MAIENNLTSKTISTISGTVQAPPTPLTQTTGVDPKIQGIATPILQKQGSFEKLFPNLKVQSSLKPDQNTIFVELNGHPAAIFRKPPSGTGVPHDAEEKLNKWLEEKKIDPEQAVGNRVSYKKEDITQALDKFKNTFHCNWHHMKEHCHDQQVIQIINDLRSSYLEAIFSELRQEFKNVKINDFGSTKLTSDRDFAFEMGATKQATESVIVQEFNKKFEQIWKLPSATVFDSNAYTMQYVLTASDPQMESKRSQLQQEGSLLMKLRTASPESWKNFKEATLKNLAEPESKELEFKKIEKKNEELKFLLNKEIIKLAMEPDLVEVNEAKDFFSMTLNDLPQNPEERKAILENVTTTVTDIKKEDPTIEIKASNSLHESIKSSYKTLEHQRIHIFSSMENLDAVKEPNQFRAQFNETLDSLIKELDPNNPKMAEQISYLESSKISEPQQDSVMQAYHDRRNLEKDEKSLHTTRKELEVLNTKIRKLEEQSYIEINKLAKIKDSFPVGALNYNDESARFAKAQLKKIQAEYGANTPSELKEKIAQKIVSTNEELAKSKAQSGQLAIKYGEYWKKAGALGLEGDRLLVKMQESNLRGMCFAQEAHVSEGAFGVVVLNIQAGISDIRTPSQYLQAFREISGFFSGHQAGKTTPSAKMIEASKYGDRLVTVINNINERANSLGVPPPVLPAEEITKMKDFFKVLGALRGGGDVAQMQRAEEAANDIYKQTMDNALLTHINGTVDTISASLETWITQLPSSQKNAYFKES